MLSHNQETDPANNREAIYTPWQEQLLWILQPMLRRVKSLMCWKNAWSTLSTRFGRRTLRICTLEMSMAPWCFDRFSLSDITSQFWCAVQIWCGDDSRSGVAKFDVPMAPNREECWIHREWALSPAGNSHDRGTELFDGCFLQFAKRWCRDWQPN